MVQKDIVRDGETAHLTVPIMCLVNFFSYLEPKFKFEKGHPHLLKACSAALSLLFYPLFERSL